MINSINIKDNNLFINYKSSNNNIPSLLNNEDSINFYYKTQKALIDPPNWARNLLKDLDYIPQNADIKYQNLKSYLSKNDNDFYNLGIYNLPKGSYNINSRKQFNTPFIRQFAIIYPKNIDNSNKIPIINSNHCYGGNGYDGNALRYVQQSLLFLTYFYKYYGKQCIMVFPQGVGADCGYDGATSYNNTCTLQVRSEIDKIPYYASWNDILSHENNNNKGEYPMCSTPYINYDEDNYKSLIEDGIYNPSCIYSSSKSDQCANAAPCTDDVGFLEYILEFLKKRFNIGSSIITGWSAAGQAINTWSQMSDVLSNYDAFIPCNRCPLNKENIGIKGRYWFNLCSKADPIMPYCNPTLLKEDITPFVTIEETDYPTSENQQYLYYANNINDSPNNLTNAWIKSSGISNYYTWSWNENNTNGLVSDNKPLLPNLDNIQLDLPDEGQTITSNTIIRDNKDFPMIMNFYFTACYYTKCWAGDTNFSHTFQWWEAYMIILYSISLNNTFNLSQ